MRLLVLSPQDSREACVGALATGNTDLQALGDRSPGHAQTRISGGPDRCPAHCGPTETPGDPHVGHPDEPKR